MASSGKRTVARGISDDEYLTMIWLALRIPMIMLEHGDTEEFKRYFRGVVRPNSGYVHKKYSVSFQKGRSGGKMEPSDKALALMDVMINNVLPLVVPEDCVAEIRAVFADGLAEAAKPKSPYVTLQDLDDEYEVTNDVPDHER